MLFTYLSAGSDKIMQVTPHDGQQIWLILISQEGNDGRTRKNIFILYYHHFGNHGNEN